VQRVDQDNRTPQRILKGMLKKPGINVYTANKGEEALAG
jgi:hypothetical protein